MAARKKGTVFRVTGLPASQPDDELKAALEGLINENLTEEERSQTTVTIAIVPSCDNEGKVALVEFRGGPPVFLSALKDDPLKSWEMEMGNTDVSFDQHFFRLTQMYTTKADTPITADIVAITGLDGHAYGSWRGKGNLGRMWLRDFLSVDLPCCRTMIYGYNSKLQVHGNHTIMDYSRELLQELEKARGTEQLMQRPLFFIAHSFGGIILAHFLVRAVQSMQDHDSTAAGLYRATYGMLLFGIPHKGLEVDDIEKMLAHEEKHPRSELLNQIKEKRGVLADQLSDFKNLIRDRKIVSFNEKQQTRRLESIPGDKGWGRIGDYYTALDDESALLELPDSIEKKIPIDADHSMMVKFDAKTDRGYTSARDELRKFEKDAPSVVARRFSPDIGSCLTGNVHWIVPRPVNSLFTGRAELLARIVTFFQENHNTRPEEQKRLAIIGIGGQGKSEVCLKAANLMRKDFWGVFWVDVDSRATATAGFAAVAKALGSSAESIEESLQALANEKRRWLLILDNADDDKTDYRQYLPSGISGAVLMTSRVEQCGQYSTIAPEILEGLDAKDSVKLLLRAAMIRKEFWPRHEQQAHDVVSLLGSHTLALVQAGAYMAEGFCRLEDYPRKFQRQRERLLKHYPSQEQSRYRDVYATFEASAEMLTGEDGQDALNLLGILAMLHWSVLPLNIFEATWKGCQIAPSNDDSDDLCDVRSCHVARLPGFLGGMEQIWDDYRLLRATSRLVSLSLVTRHNLQSSGFDGLSMHPLTHAWAKDRLSATQQQDACILAGCVLALSQVTDENHTMWRVREQELQPHLLAYFDLNIKKVLTHGPHETVLPIISECGWSLHGMGKDETLERLLENIYHSLHITPSAPSEAYVSIWRLAGNNQTALGQMERGIALLEYAVNVYEKTLGATDFSLLASQYDLAIAYCANGQTKKAVEMLQHVVEIRKSTMARTDRTLLDAQHALANAYLEDGQVKEALELQEHVVTVSETMLTTTHPDVLASQHELGHAYLEDGQTKKAIALLLRVVEGEQTIHAKTHRDLLTSQHELARAYFHDGQTKKAIMWLEHVVKIGETAVDEAYPAQLARRHDLATAYYKDGQEQRAVKLMQQVVELKKTVYTADHPRRAESERWLAYWQLSAKVNALERSIKAGR